MTPRKGSTVGNWFETGYDGVEREKVDREKRREMPWRFFLKVGQSSEVVFLDDFTRTRQVELPSGEQVNQPTTPMCFNEHNLTVDGDWKNWFTCLAKSDPPCPICGAGHYKYYIGMYTVLSSYKDDDGVVKWSKKLFGAKIDAIERIRAKQSRLTETGKIQNGQLRYVQFHVTRSGEKSVVTGDDYEFVKIMTPDEALSLLPTAQIGQEPASIAPFNYSKLFAPKTRDELDKLLASGHVQAPRKKGSPSTGGAQPNDKATIGASESDTGKKTSPADEINF